ncbi:hypothetical protein [Methylorubrum sp. SB2]|uniref:hypothetical protein n=1 Tax=Methylorubrum subtropicum TaxID=3138812 RepID=UPI00313BF03F
MDNVADARAKGRTLQGVRSPNAKLTDEDVREIVADMRPGRKIAGSYGVSLRLIQDIKHGRRWQHVLHP